MNKALYIPITSEEVQEVEGLLFTHCGTQMKNVWLLGVIIGCRINELLRMKFSDIHGDLIQVMRTRAHHTSNFNYYLTPAAKKIILNISKENPKDEFIFQSHNSRVIKSNVPKPISSHAVNRAFKDVGDILNVNLLPHSMRAISRNNLLVHYSSVNLYSESFFSPIQSNELKMIQADN
jgi:integrase